MNGLVIPERGLEQFISGLAQTHNVAYVATDDDARALAFHLEQGNKTWPDDTELLLIALSRSGVITDEQRLKLHWVYMGELNLRPSSI